MYVCMYVCIGCFILFPFLYYFIFLCALLILYIKIKVKKTTLFIYLMHPCAIKAQKILQNPDVLNGSVVV